MSLTEDGWVAGTLKRGCWYSPTERWATRKNKEIYHGKKLNEKGKKYRGRNSTFIMSLLFYLI